MFSTDDAPSLKRITIPSLLRSVNASQSLHFLSWPHVDDFAQYLSDRGNNHSKKCVNHIFKNEVETLQSLFTKDHPAQVHLAKMELVRSASSSYFSEAKHVIAHFWRKVVQLHFNELRKNQLKRTTRKIKGKKAVKLSIKHEIAKKNLEIAKDSVLVGGFHRIDQHYSDYHTPSTQLLHESLAEGKDVRAKHKLDEENDDDGELLEESDDEDKDIAITTTEEESAAEAEIPKNYLKVVVKAINSAREDQAAALSDPLCWGVVDLHEEKVSPCPNHLRAKSLIPAAELNKIQQFVAGYLSQRAIMKAKLSGSLIQAVPNVTVELRKILTPKKSHRLHLQIVLTIRNSEKKGNGDYKTKD
ncbi:hypothetical protein G9A89_005817 [Geosiphon pyriformis]|nr:hypothetical protein G9A89_005817 [Geosiphon pyriformis]